MASAGFVGYFDLRREPVADGAFVVGESDVREEFFLNVAILVLYIRHLRILISANAGQYVTG
jgi:hypothetical protein